MSRGGESPPASYCPCPMLVVFLVVVSSYPCLLASLFSGAARPPAAIPFPHATLGVRLAPLPDPQAGSLQVPLLSPSMLLIRMSSP